MIMTYVRKFALLVLLLIYDDVTGAAQRLTIFPDNFSFDGIDLAVETILRWQKKFCPAGL